MVRVGRAGHARHAVRKFFLLSDQYNIHIFIARPEKIRYLPTQFLIYENIQKLFLFVNFISFLIDRYLRERNYLFQRINSSQNNIRTQTA